MSKHHFAGAAALLLATSPAAWAEIDAQTLWADWQEMATRFGGTLSVASEDYAGGTLTLTDVTMATNLGGGEGNASYGTIRLIEQGDGTVRVEIPATMSTTSTTTVDGVTVEQTIDMTNEGLETVVREEGGLRTYDTTMQNLTAIVSTETGEAGGTPAVTISMSGLASVYRSGIDGDADAFDQTLTADSIGFAMSGEGEGEQVDLTYALTGIASDLSGNYGEAPDGPVTSFADMGMTYGGDISHSGGTFTLTGEGPQGPFSANSTSEAGKLTLDLGEDSLGYTIGSTGIDATVQAPGFPVPVKMTMAESIVGFALPFGETGVEKPFAVNLEARDLVLDDALWGLFDPTGQLPRDPATLVVDMDGSAVMNVDLFGDPASISKLQGAPGEVKTLKINEILLTLAGAALRGSGSLDFPKSTKVPEPVGTIELALDGGFALIDKIVALGFIPAEQAAFVKGMAGAVARPVGEDQLESTIEFTPGGGISANGLPLK